MNAKLKKLLLISAAVAIFIGLVWLGAGVFFMKQAIVDFPTHGKVSTLEKMKKEGTFDEKWFASVKKQDMSIVSKRDGIQLQGTLLFSPKPSLRTIVFSHGITDDRWFILKGDMLRHLLDEGYNVLTFDQRAHGKSEGDIPTYGYLEKYDLDQWIDTVAHIFPKGTIGVEGVSMGAATAVLHAGELNPAKNGMAKVAFYVFDCPYSDLEEQFVYRLNKDYHLPNMALTTSLNVVNRPYNGFSIKDVSPISAAKNIDVPVMFVHGMADTYVPTYMSEDMYRVVKSPKMLYLVPEARHAEVVMVDTNYWNVHHKFLTTIAGQKK